MSSSYRQIFKSTSLIGGSSFVRIVMQTVQTKVVAVLLGPEGVGIIGIFTSLLGIVSSITGLGLAGSGVRQIAEVAGPDTRLDLAATVKTFRIMVWGTGFLGIAVFVFFARPLTRWSFGSEDYTTSVMLLGIPLLFGALSGGQSCLLQGTRRIADLAQIGIFGSLGAATVTIPCYYWWGMRGIVPGMLLASAWTLLISWSYARRIRTEPVVLSRSFFLRCFKPMLGLGLCLMVSGTAVQATLYLSRVMLRSLVGIEQCGMFQAANSLSGVLIGFVLGAMGTDYYPKLTGLLSKRDELQQAVYDQIEISVLLGIPGLIAMVVFAPLIIPLFFSAKFGAAVLLIQILSLGMLGRLISWPLGFLILAHGDGKIFIVMEIVFGGIWLLLFWLGLKFFSLEIASFATGGNYLLHLAATISLARYRYQVKMRIPEYRAWGGAAGVLLTAFGIATLVPGLWRFSLGLLLFFGTSFVCLRLLMSRLNVTFTQIFRRFFHVGN